MTKKALYWLLGAAAIAYIYTQRDTISATASNVGDTVTASIAGWKNVQRGPQWIPYLNQVEALYGLPPDLLARIAYEESHFREEIIRGVKASPVGALGMMQMMPQYFASVTVPRPYTDTSVVNQIDEAAQLLANNYRSTQSWPLAVAAYNAGLGNVHKYGGIPPFPETQKYVAEIVADVPSLSVA